MDTLEDLSRHIEVAEDLQSVVRTMKAISAVGIRRHEAAERAMRHYLETVELGLQVVLREVPPGALTPGTDGVSEVGVVLIGSEIGLCGGFNERVVSFALDRLAEVGIGIGDRRVLIVGSRTEASWTAAGGEPPAHLQEAPATVEALAGAVDSVLTRLDQWRGEGVSHLVLFHQHMGGPEGSAPVEVRLLPIDPDWLARLQAHRWPSRRLPVCAGPVAAVTGSLVRQVLFARVFAAILQSRAAEHAERLTAMQAAERSIGDKIDELRKTHQLLRQEVITAELLDIIGGYEAASQRPGDEEIGPG